MDKALVIFIISIAIYEIILQVKWNTGYFKRGIRIYRKEFELRNPHVSLPDAKRLMEEFNGAFLAQPMIFKALTKTEMAFREKLLTFCLFPYPPIMHGMISIRRIERQVEITGLMNWNMALIITTVLFLGIINRLPEIIIFMPLIFFFMYVRQVIRYNKIVQELQKTFNNPQRERAIPIAKGRHCVGPF